MKEILFTVIVVVIFLALVYLPYKMGQYDEHANRQQKWVDFHAGYEQGVQHTMQYYKATGKYPTYYWRAMHFRDDIQSPEDVLVTIEKE
jgi:hypothetical protein